MQSSKTDGSRTLCTITENSFHKLQAKRESTTEFIMVSEPQQTDWRQPPPHRRQLPPPDCRSQLPPPVRSSPRQPIARCHSSPEPSLPDSRSSLHVTRRSLPVASRLAISRARRKSPARPTSPVASRLPVASHLAISRARRLLPSPVSFQRRLFLSVARLLSEKPLCLSAPVARASPLVAVLHADLLLSVVCRRLWQSPLPLITAIASEVGHSLLEDEEAVVVTASTESPEQSKAQHTASSCELRVDDLLSQLRSLIGDRPQHAPDPTTSIVTTAATASSSGMYSAYTVSPATDTTDWLIDSGASTHLCGDKAQFTSYVSAPPGRSVILADGKYSPVVGQGEVQLTSSLPLQHVLLHAPEFPHSLLSISQITRDLHCRAIFDSSSLVFQDILTGRVIDSGREQGGLYRLVHPIPFAGSTSSGSSSSSAYTWHLRFGHLPFQKLLHVLPQLSPQSSFQCESCQLGKHHRSSFPQRPGRSSQSVFELLHFDVWGPSRTPDLQGHRYYLVAVDDHSRVSWVFLMKKKSEVGPVIKNFINEILTQFDTCVKTVRSDNALEFCASSLEQFFRDKGIIHQTSCVYTSQQNGVAERKHCHILDVARTIIIHSHVPHSYWGDAVLTACYLINRMPSSVCKI
ncbi:Retrovirus-related Pol polyprotein from transposon TNT 1-94 [Nymphaea thermarum]|nr:Retrovirus-related Pol polyprotein from transposon TNT 1-94 [Nymphaea thermarum]